MSEVASTTDLSASEALHASTPANAMASRAREVFAYQADATRPGRPLSLLFGGGALAGVCAAFIGLLAYRTLYLQVVPESWGYTGIGLMFVIYVFGLFLFAYAWELYDTAKAVRLTLILTLASVVALVVMVAVFASLAKLKAGASILEGGSKSGAGAKDAGSLESIFHLAGTLAEDAEPAVKSNAPRARSRFEPPTRDPLPPFLITCAGCGDTFTPLPQSGACPGCGRAAVAGG